MKLNFKSKYWLPVGMFLAWVIVTSLFMFVSSYRLNLGSDNAYEWMIPAEQFAAERVSGFVSARSHWDSVWYLDIAEFGYIYQGEGQLSNIVFFPMYPGLTAALGWLIGYPLAGLLVSLAALLGVMLLLVRYVEEHHPDLDSADVLFFMLTFPTAIFLGAVYTESLFLLFVVATFYFTLKRNFWAAGALAAAAALTRVTGMLLVVPIAIEYAMAMRSENKKFSIDALAMVLPPVALGAFFLYHWIQFGSPFLFLEVQSNWGRGFEIESKHFFTDTFSQKANLWLDLFFVATAVVTTWFVGKRLRWSYAAYMLIGFIIPIATGTLMSIGRYLVVLFPIFLLGASINNPVLKKTWMLISTLLFALYTILFAVGYWAG